MSDYVQLKETVEKFGPAFEEFKKRNDQRLDEIEKRGKATGETVAIVGRINNDMTELQKRMKDIELAINRPQIDMRGKMEASAELRALDQFIRRGDRKSPDGVELRTDSDGGFLIPTELEPDLIVGAYEAAEIRPLANVSKTSKDVVQQGSIARPVMRWGSGPITLTPQELEAGKETIRIKALRGLYLIPLDTLEDTEADIISEINTGFADAIAEAEDEAFGAGTGVEGPLGIVATPTVQENFTTSGVATALSDDSNNGTDALIRLLYGLKKKYRKNGAFIMNSATEAVVRMLKDSDGRYLWQPSLQMGRPDMLLGRPVVSCEGMPDIAANSIPIAFGDLKYLKIKDRSGITIKRLEEKYADHDQLGILVKRRVGSRVVQPEAFYCLKIAA